MAAKPLPSSILSQGHSLVALRTHSACDVIARNEVTWQSRDLSLEINLRDCFASLAMTSS